jgi:hypothetical protein
MLPVEMVVCAKAAKDRDNKTNRDNENATYRSIRDDTEVVTTFPLFQKLPRTIDGESRSGEEKR